MAGVLFVWAVVSVLLMFSGVPFLVRIAIGLAGHRRHEFDDWPY